MAKLNKTEAEIRAQIEVHRKNGDIDKMTRLMAYLPNAGANKREPTQTILDRMQRIGGKVMDGISGANGAFDSAERFVKDIPRNLAEGAITGTTGLADLAKFAVQGGGAFMTGGEIPQYGAIGQGVNNLRQRASDTTGIDFTQKPPATHANQYVQTATEFSVPPIGGVVAGGARKAAVAGLKRAAPQAFAKPAAQAVAKTHPFARTGKVVGQNLKYGATPGIAYQGTEDLTGNSALAMGAAILSPGAASMAFKGGNLVDTFASKAQKARNEKADKLGVSQTMGQKTGIKLLQDIEQTANPTAQNIDETGEILLQGAFGVSRNNAGIKGGVIDEESVNTLNKYIDYTRNTSVGTKQNPIPAKFKPEIKDDLQAVMAEFAGAKAKTPSLSNMPSSDNKIVKKLLENKDGLTVRDLARFYTETNALANSSKGTTASYWHGITEVIDNAIEGSLDGKRYAMYNRSKDAFKSFKIMEHLTKNQSISKDGKVNPEALEAALIEQNGAKKYMTGKMSETDKKLKGVVEILKTDKTDAQKRGLLQRFAQAGLYSLPFIVSGGSVSGLIAIGVIAGVAPSVAAKLVKTKPVQNLLSNQGKAPSLSPAISSIVQQQDAGKPTHPFERKMK